MRTRLFAGTAFAAALLAAGAAQAQTRPGIPGTTAAPVTDVGPPPAEDRDSSGALVLEHSMLKAQGDKAFSASAGRTGVGTVGRGVVRARTVTPLQGELASARESEAAELYRRGAGSLTEK